MDYSKLGTQASKTDSTSRNTVVGRVLQDDTDFICYQCANVGEPLSVAVKAVLANVERARKMCGAERVNMHLTMGMKGGRKEMATVAPYQEKRNKKKDPVLAQRVHDIRVALANHKSRIHTPIVNIHQEADDSLRQMQEARIKVAGINSSILRSGDKDLWFTDGIHMDDLGRFYTVDGFGVTDYREVGNVKPKLIGRGTSWFWHQMVMGDGVDNIPGLPRLSGRLANVYLPTKKYNAKRKPMSCGEAKAVAMLKGVTTEQEAARRVMEAYQDHYGMLLGAEMLVEQAFLLWIRKTNKLTEVIDYLKSCGLNVSFSDAQIKRLRAYGALVKAQKEMSNG